MPESRLSPALRQDLEELAHHLEAAARIQGAYKKGTTPSRTVARLRIAVDVIRRHLEAS